MKSRITKMKLSKLSLIAGLVLFASPCMALPVNLKTKTGHYLVAENGGGDAVNANRAKVGSWETFDLRDLNGGSLRNGDKVCLISKTGHYLVAHNGGGSSLNANGNACGASAQFTIFRLDATRRFQSEGKIRSGDYVAFKTNNGNYFAAEHGGGGELNANRTLNCQNGKCQLPGSWETFQILM